VLLIFDDLGSGALIDFSAYGLPKEPTVQESLKAGADVVCFSGDKLIGGPQCGIIRGRKEIIDRVKKNQLSRALRCDKMTYAVLEATVRLFLDEKELLKSHPVIRMMIESSYDVKKRCMTLKRKMKVSLGEKAKLKLVDEFSEVGSGSMSTQTLPTWAVAIKIKDMAPDTLAAQLRLSNPPVFGRVKDDQFLLDCRTIADDELQLIVKVFELISEKKNSAIK
jgi:L-seryl-tRNA(Ser) seleniumtransferase